MAMDSVEAQIEELKSIVSNESFEKELHIVSIELATLQVEFDQRSVGLKKT